MCLFFLVSAVAELLAILGFFTKEQSQNISGTNAATWRHNLAAYIPSLNDKQESKRF